MYIGLLAVYSNNRLNKCVAHVFPFIFSDFAAGQLNEKDFHSVRKGTSTRSPVLCTFHSHMYIMRHCYRLTAVTVYRIRNNAIIELTVLNTWYWKFLTFFEHHSWRCQYLIYWQMWQMMEYTEKKILGNVMLWNVDEKDCGGGQNGTAALTEGRMCMKLCANKYGVEVSLLSFR